MADDDRRERLALLRSILDEVMKMQARSLGSALEGARATNRAHAKPGIEAALVERERRLALNV